MGVGRGAAAGLAQLYLTTVRPDGTPHVMPLWGIWVDGRLYFSTGAQSRKARNLAANARCVVCTENAAEAVVVEGMAIPLDDGARLEELAPHYAKKYKSFTLDPKMRSSAEGRVWIERSRLQEHDTLDIR